MTTTTFPDLREVKGIKPQAKMVYEVLAEGLEWNLASIRRQIESRGVWCLETSISARIRELNAYFRNNDIPLRIVHRYEKPGSNNTLYSIETK